MKTSSSLIAKLVKRYQGGGIKQAEKLCGQILYSDPTEPVALNILGAICLNQCRYVEAINLISRALKVRPNDHQSLANLALAQLHVGDNRAALQNVNTSLSLKANNANALNTLGSIHKQNGDLESAVAAYKLAVKLNAKNVGSLLNLCEVARLQNEPDLSLSYALEAKRIAPNSNDVILQLANAYTTIPNFKQSIYWYRKVIEVDRLNLIAWIGLIDVLRESTDILEAQKALQQAFILFPENSKVHYAQGILFDQCGEKENAIKHFSLAIKSEPNWAKPHYQLLRLDKKPLDCDVLDRITNLPRTNNVDSEVYRYFARALVYEKQSDFKSAFEAWTFGNELLAKRSFFDYESRIALYASIADVVCKVAQKKVGVASQTPPTPIFVIGMPRSGTTLIGQIIAQHSCVQSLGETALGVSITREAEAIGGDPYPKVLNKLTTENFDALGRNALKHVGSKLNATTYVLDITPTNFQHLGPIALSIPNAKFIHCVRDPIDTCFSIYKQPLAVGQDYSTRLKWVAQQYKAYRHLMEVWSGLFQSQIHQVKYEDVILHNEREVRSICAFLHLSFEPKMQKFHESKNLVRSPSSSDVRIALYPTAIDSWRNYENYLETLINELAT